MHYFCPACTTPTDCSVPQPKTGITNAPWGCCPSCERLIDITIDRNGMLVVELFVDNPRLSNAYIPTASTHCKALRQSYASLTSILQALYPKDRLRSYFVRFVSRPGHMCMVRGNPRPEAPDNRHNLPLHLH